MSPTSMRQAMFLVLVCITLSACARVADQQATPIKRISANALASGEYQIVGVFGKPYGEIVHISAIWRENSPETVKDDGMFSLVVSTVDDDRLPPPNEIRIPGMLVDYVSDSERPAQIADGDKYDGPVFESGKYMRAPPEAYKLVGDESHGRTADNYAFRFYSFVYLIRNEAGNGIGSHKP